MIIKTDYIKANAFAFYSINGRNLRFNGKFQSRNVCEFLVKIVEQNPKTKIFLFWIIQGHIMLIIKE
jgi:hypothetical protein